MSRGRWVKRTNWHLQDRITTTPPIRKERSLQAYQGKNQQGTVVEGSILMLQELICQRKCGRLGMVFSAEAPACMEILESIYFHTIKNMTCPGRGHMQGNSRD